MASRRVIGVLFPGQGSQFVGMLRPFKQHGPIFRDLIDSADAALGYSLSSIIAKGPLDLLTRTEHAQPAILLASICHWKWWRETKAQPEAEFVMAGHSLGEYSALVAGGYLSLQAGLRLTALRGRIMSECAIKETPGMMIVLNASQRSSLDECQARLQEWLDPKRASISAYNSSLQLVLAGTVSHLEKIMTLISEHCPKVKVHRLRNVSCAFHSPLMRSAQERFRQEAQGIFTLTSPSTNRNIVLSNVTAEPVISSDYFIQVMFSILQNKSLRGYVAKLWPPYVGEKAWKDCYELDARKFGQWVPQL